MTKAMPDEPLTTQQLLEENQALRVRLEEAQETLNAIRSGEVDALVVLGPKGEQIYTLKGAEEPYRFMVEAMAESAVTFSEDGTILYCNAQFSKLVRTPHERIIGQMLHDWIAAQDRDRFGFMLAQGLQGIVRESMVLQTSHETLVPAHISMYPLPENAGRGIAAVITDITEVTAAVETSSRLALIVDSSDVAIISASLDGLVESWNKAAERLFGYTTAEAVGRPIQHLIIPPEQISDITQTLDNLGSAGGVGYAETLLRRKDGALLNVSATASPINDVMGKRIRVSFILRDITERKRAEVALRRANRALRTLSAGNLALVQAASEDELLSNVTSIISDQGGYSLASVGYAEDDPERSIRLMACSTSGDSYCLTERFSWEDTEEGQLPIGRAIRSGSTQICHDIASDTGFKTWKDSALARGYVSNIVLPLREDGRTFGALSIYSSTTDAFDAEEVQLLEELANALAYGIITLRARIEHDQHAAKLRQSLEQSIQTIAGTLEARDPYTAGHQRRVAELATAIARKMGLAEERVNAIHFAAIIHDVGKIHIPAEILAKPAKLSPIEFMFIKTHPQAGCEILKDVEFPWPIKDIILQHHEKMDGSGYPQGLKDGQILLESKILTVADVVEAISSHRPYRPALGVGAALEEIRLGRGILYDPAVVDVCLNLFNEAGFMFSIDIQVEKNEIPKVNNDVPNDRHL